MSKHLRKNFSIIKPELQDLIDKKKGKVNYDNNKHEVNINFL